MLGFAEDAIPCSSDKGQDVISAGSGESDWENMAAGKENSQFPASSPVQQGDFRGNEVV